MWLVDYLFLRINNYIIRKHPPYYFSISAKSPYMRKPHQSENRDSDTSNITGEYFRRLPHFLVNQNKFWYNLGFPNPLIGNQVRHLLIILSILLLSSPVIGQETGVLFLREVNDKWGWFEDGNKDKDAKYIGEFKDGFLKIDNQMVKEQSLTQMG